MSGLYASLWNIGIRAIKELEADRGILASGRSEVYGCIFGRDSLITSLSLLDVYEKSGDTYYLELVRKVLVNLADLQGRETNIESGEEPGKIIHEYRPDNHEHLTRQPEKPWYVYGDGQMRNYDSVDSTPLFLMTAHRYLSVAKDTAFTESMLPSIRAALQWTLSYGDSNGDGFLDYRFHPERTYGGLSTQSWMDSAESVFFEESADAPAYPVAPVEVQAYAYVALRAWSQYFENIDETFSGALSERAAALKKEFNAHYLIEERGGNASLAFAIDGKAKPMTSPRSSMGHCLWAAWKIAPGAMPDSILDKETVPLIARRVLQPDLYIPRAGIRTLSVRSRAYNPNSYHNGSIWPHDTAMIADGLENFGFREEAKRVRRSLISAYAHFNTPIELFVYTRGYKEYCGENGQEACRTQAWSTASLLSIVHSAEHPTS